MPAAILDEGMFAGNIPTGRNCWQAKGAKLNGIESEVAKNPFHEAAQGACGLALTWTAIVANATSSNDLIMSCLFLFVLADRYVVNKSRLYYILIVVNFKSKQMIFNSLKNHWVGQVLACEIPQCLHRSDSTQVGCRDYGCCKASSCTGRLEN